MTGAYFPEGFDGAVAGDPLSPCLIRAILPRHTAKHLARLMGVPVATARSWLYQGVSASRRRQIAAVLLAEFRRQEDERRRLRIRLWSASNGRR